MKDKLLIAFLTLLLACSGSVVRAQRTDTARSSVSTSTAPQQDDDFDLFLLAYGIAFIAIVIAAILLGIALLIGFLLVLFALVSAGIFSTGVLVGMQKRSVAAGFRIILVIVCCLGGLFTGATGLWLVDRGFHLHWRPSMALLTGALGGGMGGIVLGLIVFKIILYFLTYCRRRLSF